MEALSAPLDDDEGRHLPLRLRPYTTSEWYCGFDVGQARDASALVLLEKRQRYAVGGHSNEPRPCGEPSYWVVDAVRLALNLPYPAQAAYVAAVMAREPLAGKASLLCDRTGVGRAVYDELRKLRVSRLIGVTITGGEEPARDGPNWRVPKVRLVAIVDAKLNDGGLKISPEMPLADELRLELENFRVGFTGLGNMTFGAAGSGHDDVALALSLALWGAAGRPAGGAGAVSIGGLW